VCGGFHPNLVKLCGKLLDERRRWGRMVHLLRAKATAEQLAEMLEALGVYIKTRR
jgi:hypothetical protein